jgi:hypothetical protein
MDLQKFIRCLFVALSALAYVRRARKLSRYKLPSVAIAHVGRALGRVESRRASILRFDEGRKVAENGFAAHQM